MEEKLKKWQVLYIDNVKYLVMSMIEFEENTDIWREYEIRDELGKSKILCIEKNETNKTEYSIYTPYTGDINEKDIYMYRFKKFLCFSRMCGKRTKPIKNKLSCC